MKKDSSKTIKIELSRARDCKKTHLHVSFTQGSFPKISENIFKIFFRSFFNDLGSFLFILGQN